MKALEYELCGRKKNVEVHHIVPKVACRGVIDPDEEENLICLCNKCHALLTPRGFLSKYGQKKAIIPSENLQRFYRIVNKVLDENGTLNVSDVFDVVEDVWGFGGAKA